MKRMVSRLLDLAVAVALSLALANVERLRAAERPHLGQGDVLSPIANSAWQTENSK